MTAYGFTVREVPPAELWSATAGDDTAETIIEETAWQGAAAAPEAARAMLERWIQEGAWVLGASMTFRDRLMVRTKSAVRPWVTKSAREGRMATASAVPMIVSGTCSIVQPRLSAPTPTVPKRDARLSRATKYA